MKIYVIGKIRNHEHLENIKDRINEFDNTYEIIYDMDSDFTRSGIIWRMRHLMECDAVYVLSNIKSTKVYEAEYAFSVAAGLDIYREKNIGNWALNKTFTTEDGYVVTRSHTPEFVRDVMKRYNQGMSTTAIAYLYSTHQKTIWRIVDRNRHKITRDDL